MDTQTHDLLDFFFAYLAILLLDMLPIKKLVSKLPTMASLLLPPTKNAKTQTSLSPPSSPEIQPQSLDKFHLFEKLSLELRLQIWIFALPPPRTIELRFATSLLSLTHDFIVPSHYIPILLHVSHEARTLALKHYSLSFSHPLCQNPCGIYFDFYIDTLHIRDEDLYTGASSWQIKETLGLMGKEERERVRRLSVCDFAFMNPRNWGNELRPPIFMFPNLEKVTVRRVIQYNPLGQSREWHEGPCSNHSHDSHNPQNPDETRKCKGKGQPSCFPRTEKLVARAWKTGEEADKKAYWEKMDRERKETFLKKWKGGVYGEFGEGWKEPKEWEFGGVCLRGVSGMGGFGGSGRFYCVERRKGVGKRLEVGWGC